VELVLNVDGVGDPKLKIDKYNAFMKRRDRARNGFKVFYEEDTNRLSPAEVMRLRPEPEFVVYE
jgi:transcriptional antiterminator